jgi:hypothetical protein
MDSGSDAHKLSKKGTIYCRRGSFSELIDLSLLLVYPFGSRFIIQLNRPKQNLGWDGKTYIALLIYFLVMVYVIIYPVHSRFIVRHNRFEQNLD